MGKKLVFRYNCPKPSADEEYTTRYQWLLVDISETIIVTEELTLRNSFDFASNLKLRFQQLDKLLPLSNIGYRIAQLFLVKIIFFYNLYI